MSRTGLGHRTATALVPFLVEQDMEGAGAWGRVRGRLRQRRGVGATWRRLKSHVAARPSLTRAVEQATTAPGTDTCNALAEQLEHLFDEDRGLADLVQADLEEQTAREAARSTRLRRWTRTALALFVAAFVVEYALGEAVRVNLVGEEQAYNAYEVLLGAVVVSAGLAFLYRRLGQFAWLVNWLTVLVVTGGMVAAINFTVDPAENIWVAKTFAIMVLTVLPGWLYFQFVAMRGRSVWEDYVSNLFRLRVDDYGNLPEPARGTKEHRLWRQADGPADAGAPYRNKFEAAYGKVLAGGVRGPGGRRRRDGFAPVVFLTLLTAFGWTAVLLPAYDVATVADLGGSRLWVALTFAFIGAYWFNLQSIVRRYFHNDLSTNAYISGVIRLIVVILLVAVVYQVWPTGDGLLNAVAFTIGVFPNVGLQIVQKAITRVVGPLTELRNEFPLTHLDGLNMWYESRLVEEGIEDLQNLATADIVDMLLSTRVPVGRLVDWIDQAHLFLRVEQPEQRAQLRRLGIRTATDLQNAFPPARSATPAAAWPERAAQVRDVLYPGNPDAVGCVDMLLASFDGEVTLRHVRGWRSFEQPAPEVLILPPAPAFPTGSRDASPAGDHAQVQTSP